MIELPGGNDTDILQATFRQNHSLVFLTQILALYRKDPEIFRWVSLAKDIIELPDFSSLSVENAVMQSHTEKPFDALLCLLDTKLHW